MQMRLMDDYYKPYGEKPRIYAGVINVVLALGYRVQLCEHGDTYTGFNEVKIKACVDNAQTMLDELMTRDQDTLGLQALLGLVVRLAHSLRLESKTDLLELPPSEARQRANIFWVCYMLDKDISLRTMTPSIQIDSDIDIDLPGSTSDDCEALIYSTDKLSQFHLFRFRVQLAHLEGRIYDTLLSNRSRKLSHEARQQAVVQIDELMECWKRSIPTPFQLDHMTGNLLPWGGLGSDLLRSFNHRVDGCMNGNTSSTPAVWNKCVTTSRAILNILSYQSFGGCSVWLSACAYFSAMTFVFVNLIYHPTGKLAESDRELAELSMLQLQKYFDYKGLEKFKQLRHVLVQIESMAKLVREGARVSWPRRTSRSRNVPSSPRFFRRPLMLLA
ncbi:hypothetical protein ONZ43_g3869 [Nemania bipapillata]|uniref:Uncharacterized protein n=1 Tax=Nemania bipapillata TaxID=110536 RepID=A0ACC2IV33_9PEZI|nr:hypothetical protein ONZ43_g3869 [Nemania bipapillata]